MVLGECQVTVPYLRSEYGKDYDFDAPVKLLDEMLHGMARNRRQQVVVLGHVLAADINIGYEVQSRPTRVWCRVDRERPSPSRHFHLLHLSFLSVLLQ